MIKVKKVMKLLILIIKSDLKILIYMKVKNIIILKIILLTKLKKITTTTNKQYLLIFT